MTFTHKLATLAGLTLLSISTACGGGGGSTDGNPDGGGTPPTLGPETVEVYCDTVYATFAARYAECSKGSLAWATHTVDKTTLCPPIVTAVNQGTATYDRTAAGGCLAFFEGASCTDVRAIREDVKYVAACRDAVVGKGVSGASPAFCASDADCASARCYTWTCPGMCYTGDAQGQPCAGDRDCAKGLYCFMGAGHSGSTCRPHDSRPALNESCTISTGCLPGLYCEGSTHSLLVGTCKPQITSGACPTNALAMAPGYGCFGGVTQPLIGEGAACTSYPDYCGPGLYCGSQAVCTRDPVVGETCPFGDAQPCIGGSCFNYAHVCAEVAPSTCYSDWDCESKGVCDEGCRAYCF